jgi:archaellum component FlaD/FlaE
LQRINVPPERHGIGHQCQDQATEDAVVQKQLHRPRGPFPRAERRKREERERKERRKREEIEREEREKKERKREKKERRKRKEREKKQRRKRKEREKKERRKREEREKETRKKSRCLDYCANSHRFNLSKMSQKYPTFPSRIVSTLVFQKQPSFALTFVDTSTVGFGAP